MANLILVGRSSSHFTRVARIFAHELAVAHEFRPVLDLTSVDAAAYANNPALKIPILVDEHGPLFGAENICRELTRRSGKEARVVLRGQVTDRLVMNAEELTLHVMSSEVNVIMTKFSGGTVPAKVSRSIENSLGFLDENIANILAALPADRALSFLEVALFSVLTHLPWRDVLDVTPWARLAEFTRSFGQRESARATEYRFDAQ
jgi:glutathione S-transferase